MGIFKRRYFTRDVHSTDLFEVLLVTAVATMLTVRAILASTGYPQLGARHHLHIAHVLWGGLLMVAALIILFRYWNSSTRRLASFVGGMGFGLFIDELGKFLTQDDDYFYRPAIALIYTTFMLMFVLLRFMERRGAFLEDEIIISDAINRLELVPTAGETRWYRSLVEWMDDRYRRAAKRQWFTPGLGLFFLALAFWQLLAASGVAFYEPRAAHLQTIQLVAAGGSALFILIGIASLGRSRYRASLWLNRGILINITVIQPFLFYSWQFGALTGLAVNLFVYISTRHMMNIS